MEDKIDDQQFFKRVDILYKAWSENFQNFDTYILTNGKDHPEATKIKTSAMHIWLFGIELIDTVIIFAKNSIYFVMSNKKFQHLDHFKQNTKFQERDIKFVEKKEENQQTILDVFKEIFGEKEQPNIATLIKEKQKGKLADDMTAAFGKHVHNQIDAGQLVQQCLYLKDEKEIKNIQNAAKLTTYFYKHIENEVKNVINEDTKRKHMDIATKVQKIFENDQQMNKVCAKYQLVREFSELAYSPIVQSGGKYDLRPQAESNNENLKFDTIILSCGFKYISYHANIVRTIFISPDKKIEDTYKIVEEIFDYLTKNLKPGKTLSSIYEGAQKIAQKLDTQKLPVNFGFGMGLEFKEGNLIIKAGNETKIQEGMVFNVNIALDSMTNNKGKNFAIQISDTVIVKPQEVENVITTNGAERRYKHISFTLNEDDGSEDSDESEGISKENIQYSTNKSGYNTRSQRTTNKQKIIEAQKQEQQRSDNQKKLLNKKSDEIQKRFEEGAFNGVKQNSKAIEAEKFKNFKDQKEIENEYKNLCFNVDLKKLVVLIPLAGRLIPFDGNLIKSFSKVQENSNIRLNLHVPNNQASSQGKFKWPKLGERELYIKECTITLKNPAQSEEYLRKLKDLQQRIKLKEAEKQAKLEVEQEQIQYNKGKRPVLKDLKIRPPLSQKKVSGYLECHLNGFKYQTQKGDKVEIAFSNIKHAFYQPCINDIIVILHFNLHHAILVGKKKTHDVQFYGEIQVANEDTMGRGRGDDEYEEEQREKMMRKKLNKEFNEYITIVANETNQEVNFDIPYQKLAFWGSPSRTNCQIVPTVNCLINITEQSPFILCLDEVEVACFERMTGGLKNCDLVFIFKDYDKQVQRISSIPVEYVETIKNLLDKMQILFFIIGKSLNWQNILQTIKADIPKFVEEGCWNFLVDDEDEDDDQQEQSEGEDEFKVDSEDIDNQSESNFSDEDDSDEYSGSDEGSSSFEEQGLSEEGLSWDEMENQAYKEDRRRDAKRDEQSSSIKNRPMQQQRRR